MFLVRYVKKKMSAFYSCFDFEQILFPVQLNLCTWLACSFSPVTTFSGGSRRHSIKHGLNGKSQWGTLVKILFSVTHLGDFSAQCWVWFAHHTHTHAALFYKQNKNRVLSLNVPFARYNWNASSVPAILSWNQKIKKRVKMNSEVKP